MNSGIATLIGVIAAAIAAIPAYLVGRRKTSGTVDTSEADTLWEESRAIRKELREEAVGLRMALDATHKEAVLLRQKADECCALAAELKLEIARLKGAM